MSHLLHFSNKTKLQKYKSFFEHEAEIRSMLIGHMLGDGHAEREPVKNSLKYKNTRIKFQFGDLNLEYAKHIHSIFSEKGYCNTSVLKLKKVFDTRTNRDYFHVHFNTYNFKNLNELHSMFYRLPTAEESAIYLKKTGKKLRFIKIIPKNIAELLTPQALAIWIMDDGDFTAKSGTLRIATHSFSIEEVSLLQQALLINFNLKTNLHQERENQYRMYFPKTEVQKIIPLIKLYLVPSMMYKLGLDENK